MAKELVTPEKNISEVLGFIEKASIFKELSQESLEKISEKIQMENFAKDHTVFHLKRTQARDRVYLLMESSRIIPNLL